MDTLITALVEGILVPLITVITTPVAWLAASGLLVIVFGVVWGALAVALVRDPARIDSTWRRLRGTPIVVQALAWLLFLPVLAAIVAWRTGWPAAVRLAVVGGLAGWNLLMFLPRPA